MGARWPLPRVLALVASVVFAALAILERHARGYVYLLPGGLACLAGTHWVAARVGRAPRP